MKGKKDKEIKEVERACVSMLGEAGRNGFLSVGTSTPQGHESGPKPLRACQLVVISFFPFSFVFRSVMFLHLEFTKGNRRKSWILDKRYFSTGLVLFLGWNKMQEITMGGIIAE